MERAFIHEIARPAWEVLAMGSASEMAIFFRGHSSGRHVCFNNFHPAVVRIDGREWPTVEHYFQAMKAHHESEQEIVRLCATPK